MPVKRLVMAHCKPDLLLLKTSAISPVINTFNTPAEPLTAHIKPFQKGLILQTVKSFIEDKVTHHQSL